MGVKTIEEIRYENFLILVEEAGSVARFAERMKKSYSQVSQIKNKSPESKTGKPKEIGSSQAREMEAAFGKERGWMDHEQLDHEAQKFKQLHPEVRAWILKNAESNEKRAETKIEKEPSRQAEIPPLSKRLPQLDIESTLKRDKK